MTRLALLLFERDLLRFVAMLNALDRELAALYGEVRGF
jgi:hypothetical protein